MFLNIPLDLIGMILGGVAMFVFLISSFLKTKKQILLDQTCAHVILAISEALMKTYSSIVQEMVSIIRNISVLLGKNTKWLNIFLVAFGAVFGLVANILWDDNSWYGYLPIIANLEYSIVIISPLKSEKYLKLSLSLSCYLWAIFFIVTRNYLAGGFNLVTGTIALVASIILFTKKENKDNLE